MQDKINEYNEIHNKSIERIKLYCKDAVIGKLCTWLMTTNINPYSFFTDDMASRVGTATGMDGVMTTISHAVNDDGAISFVLVNGSPKIIFLNPNDFTDVEEFNQHCLNPLQKELQHTYGDYKVEVLDCTVDDIGEIIDAHNAAYKINFEMFSGEGDD